MNHSQTPPLSTNQQPAPRPKTALSKKARTALQPFVKNQQTFSRCTHNKIENWPLLFLSASDKPRSLTRSQGYIHQEFHDPLLLNSSISGKNAARRPLKIYFTQITEEPPQILPLPANHCSPRPCDPQPSRQIANRKPLSRSFPSEINDSHLSYSSSPGKPQTTPLKDRFSQKTANHFQTHPFTTIRNTNY